MMEDIRIGYHYTGKKDWEIIRREGLKPYSISHPQFPQYLGVKTIEGIWIWKEKLKGLSHIGFVIYQMVHKATIDVVLLEVRYHIKNILRPSDFAKDVIALPHFGTIDNLEYHAGNDISYIVTETIPTCDIKFLEEFNLLNAWKVKNQEEFER